MQDPMVAGAVVYAKDIRRVSRFYSELAAWAIVEDEPGHVVLQSDAFQLAIVAVPPAIAARIAIASPPARREDTAVKLCFAVASLAGGPADRGAAWRCGARTGTRVGIPWPIRLRRARSGRQYHSAQVRHALMQPGFGRDG
jgi:hypothetical protein